YTRGESDYPGGAFALLQETFRYNFGIEIDHFARVNFAGFMNLIDMLGGLTISVDCAITDWRLIDPEADPELEESWEMYTLGVGQARLKPYMALWYVRSRKSTDELDRGRRQMDVLRALWQQFQKEGILANVERLWPNIEANVHTDMTLADVLALVPLATEIELSEVARYSGSVGLHYTQTYTPDNGREILLPNRDYLIPMLTDFLTPATANRLNRQAIRVEIMDGSWYGIGLEHVAADRLAWEGFHTIALPGLSEIKREYTVIYDYTGQTKGSALPDLQHVLRVAPESVIRQPDPNRTVDYRVEIGTEYELCRYGNAEDEVAINTLAAEEMLADLPVSACWLQFAAQVNVRSGPDTIYDILDTVTPNDHLPVTGRTLDGHWWRVLHESGTGWVSAQITNVRLSGDCSSVPAVEMP
ncbi:MAG: LCP family protein, partial [Anaerolineae bacterium]|nr:LCP family protein [Anaerolineae bacterium]